MSFIASVEDVDLLEGLALLVDHGSSEGLGQQSSGME
jgi:hypothetical protein